MDIDDNDDDFYAPEEPTVSTTAEPAQTGAHAATEAAHTEAKPDADEDLEEGEEEDEGGAMDEDDSSDDVRSPRAPRPLRYQLTPALRVWSSSQRGRTAHPRRHHRKLRLACVMPKSLL